jgi:hypothetical protein
MNPDQPECLHSLIRIHVVCLQTLQQVEKLAANSMDPDQTAQAGLDPCWSQTHYVVLSWCGSTQFDTLWFKNKFYVLFLQIKVNFDLRHFGLHMGKTNTTHKSVFICKV